MDEDDPGREAPRETPRSELPVGRAAFLGMVAAGVGGAATGASVTPPSSTAMERLTPRELQVAMAVAGGATNREAARALFLSEKTVERHLSAVYAKLGLRSRTELARLLARG